MQSILLRQKKTSNKSCTILHYISRLQDSMFKLLEQITTDQYQNFRIQNITFEL